MIRHGYRDSASRGIGPLHDDVASATSHFAEAVLLQDLTGLAPGEDAEPTLARGRELRRVLPIILVGTGGGLRNDLPA